MKNRIKIVLLIGMLFYFKSDSDAQVSNATNTPSSGSDFVGWNSGAGIPLRIAPLRRISKFFVRNCAISNPLFKAQRVYESQAIIFEGIYFPQRSLICGERFHLYIANQYL
jgi:hypothetical protein